MTCCNVEPDELHVVHLGTSALLLGSCLWLLVYERLPHTPQANVEQIWAELCEGYVKHRSGTQFSSLTLSSFCDPDKPHREFPKLRGRGAEVKDLVLPLVDCWRRHRRNTDDDALLLDVLYAQADMQSILSDHADEPFLPLEVARRFEKCCWKMVQGTTVLALSAQRQKKLLFNVVPKHHWAIHMGLRSHWVNPRKANTMIDEDFVKHIKHIVVSSAHGTAPHDIPSKVVEKYRIGIWLLVQHGLRLNRKG